MHIYSIVPRPTAMSGISVFTCNIENPSQPVYSSTIDHVAVDMIYICCNLTRECVHAENVLLLPLVVSIDGSASFQHVHEPACELVVPAVNNNHCSTRRVGTPYEGSIRSSAPCCV